MDLIIMVVEKWGKKWFVVGGKYAIHNVWFCTFL